MECLPGGVQIPRRETRHGTFSAPVDLMDDSATPLYAHHTQLRHCPSHGSARWSRQRRRPGHPPQHEDPEGPPRGSKDTGRRLDERAFATHGGHLRRRPTEISADLEGTVSILRRRPSARRHGGGTLRPHESQRISPHKRPSV